MPSIVIACGKLHQQVVKTGNSLSDRGVTSICESFGSYSLELLIFNIPYSAVSLLTGRFVLISRGIGIKCEESGNREIGPLLLSR